MEVHPPEHGIHSWRDFLVHMGTITLGLLIALGLEAAVEALHRHHQMQEARERIDHEIAGNRGVIAKDRDNMKQAMERTRGNINVLDAPGDPDTTKLHFGWTWEDPQNSAWDTARATGALALLPYDQAQHYADIYDQQELVREAAKDYVQKQVHLVTPLMRRGDLYSSAVRANLSQTERQQLADNSAESLTQIGLLLNLTTGLTNLYEAR